MSPTNCLSHPQKYVAYCLAQHCIQLKIQIRIQPQMRLLSINNLKLSSLGKQLQPLFPAFLSAAHQMSVLQSFASFPLGKSVPGTFDLCELLNPCPTMLFQALHMGCFYYLDQSFYISQQGHSYLVSLRYLQHVVITVRTSQKFKTLI